MRSPRRADRTQSRRSGEPDHQLGFEDTRTAVRCRRVGVRDHGRGYQAQRCHPPARGPAPAPNLLVARTGADSYAISARGFNSTTANKLQVLIDGRIAYTPLYSGLFWDAQDLMLEDIERIEVISGPGATLWGSNAVNGVINVISRPASETRGTLLRGGAGNLERGAALRHGGPVGADSHFRVYGQGFRVPQSEQENGSGARDGWHKGQAGFRLDSGELTLQGDLYEGRLNRETADSGEIRGLNLLSRWRHDLDDGSSLQLQAYYDRTERELPGLFAETLDIVDLELQHNLNAGDGHRVVWGLGYRHAWDEVSNSALLQFLPDDERLHWSNAFVQDEIRLRPNLHLTLGARLEHNRYTGFEFMPNVRLGWNLTPRDLLWASLARSVRTPSRLDRDFFVPFLPSAGGPFNGGPDFESETADSLELGYRGSRGGRFNYSITAFYQDYDKLRAVEPVGDGTFVLGNGIEAQIYGLEAWGDYQVNEGWQLNAGALLRRDELDLDRGSLETSQGNDPSHQWLLRSRHALSPVHEFDWTIRHVGKLPDPEVPAYTALDIRLGWQPRPELELSLSGWNLLDDRHPEFGQSGSRSEVERSLYLELLLRFR
ncbi:TonB-dependent receptor plug domain-containing protein [Marinobacterium aestuariivivens]|uniref:TonB-dependent receptor plug domain-containing protein n=1 Tax=Marinobacterium aestuariivivens TaxID=1698799 RepID=A0ABW1ZVN5_9GAMM